MKKKRTVREKIKTILNKKVHSNKGRIEEEEEQDEKKRRKRSGRRSKRRRKLRTE